ncbi:Brix domain-containing protein [Exophiala viscosa]|uniref:Brix domain-containing protein n=1 Tax=Exophiala viscosa TaxID=2486360 RepID=A0AAN6E075_9EURO|nr:Brix domain-containing protein [Exophiala viscosa]KAI1624289.1 Brix domain-containing protein [Exophiala viscosa]
MASAYKSAMRGGDLSESDSDASEQSSNTLPNESADEKENPVVKTKRDDASQIPVEIRNRILMLTSRGVSYRHRHLLSDLHSLLPHTYKDTKLDTKTNNHYNAALNGLADLHSCNYVFYLEARKHGQDLYLWLARAPNGPTIKFNVTNVHTQAELGFGGNCLKGGRGVVVFDKSFDEELAGQEHRSLIREMLRGVFCVPPKGVRGMKPFIDRIIGIYGLDGKIWVRVYEIRESEPDKASKESGSKGADISLVEIGPRFVLTPIVILEGSFGGPLIFENKQFVSPNQLRADQKTKKAGRYASRRAGAEEIAVKRRELGIKTGVKRKASALDNARLFG